MKTIKIHYDNGDSTITRINASVEEIARLYLDRRTVIAEDFENGGEKWATIRAVEFLDEQPEKVGDCYRTLKRIYSLSREFMERHELYSKWRFTAINRNPKPIYNGKNYYIIDAALTGVTR